MERKQVEARPVGSEVIAKAAQVPMLPRKKAIQESIIKSIHMQQDHPSRTTMGLEDNGMMNRKVMAVVKEEVEAVGGVVRQVMAVQEEVVVVDQGRRKVIPSLASFFNRVTAFVVKLVTFAMDDRLHHFVPDGTLRKHYYFQLIPFADSQLTKPCCFRV